MPHARALSRAFLQCRSLALPVAAGAACSTNGRPRIERGRPWRDAVSFRCRLRSLVLPVRRSFRTFGRPLKWSREGRKKEWEGATHILQLPGRRLVPLLFPILAQRFGILQRPPGPRIAFWPSFSLLHSVCLCFLRTPRFRPCQSWNSVFVREATKVVRGAGRRKWRERGKMCDASRWMDEKYGVRMPCLGSAEMSKRWPTGFGGMAALAMPALLCHFSLVSLSLLLRCSESLSDLPV